jgi:hypothetical protein
LAKFRADVDEIRYYPTLGIEVAPKDVVELPADTEIAGLTLLTESKKSDAKVVAVEEDAAAAADTEGV